MNEEIIELLNEVKDGVENQCCAITMDVEEVLEKIEKIESLIKS